MGSNPAYTQPELAHLLRITKAKFLLAGSTTLNAARPAAAECGIPKKNIFIFGAIRHISIDGVQNWGVLLDCGQSDWYRFDNEYEAKNTVAMLSSTSGTTGPPKAAMLSHYTLVALTKQTTETQNKPYEVSIFVDRLLF